jgi:mono/diheme cytochrome c family protein
MTSLPDLDQMTPEQLRALAAQLMSKVDTQSRKRLPTQRASEIEQLLPHKWAPA